VTIPLFIDPSLRSGLSVGDDVMRSINTHIMSVCLCVTVYVLPYFAVRTPNSVPICCRWLSVCFALSLFLSWRLEQPTISLSASRNFCGHTSKLFPPASC